MSTAIVAWWESARVGGRGVVVRWKGIYTPGRGLSSGSATLGLDGGQLHNSK